MLRKGDKTNVYLLKIIIYLTSLVNPIENATAEVIIAKISQMINIKNATSKLLPSTPNITLEINSISVFNNIAADPAYNATGSSPSTLKSLKSATALITKPIDNTTTADVLTGYK